MLTKWLTTQADANLKPAATVKALTQKQYPSALRLPGELILIECSLGIMEKLLAGSTCKAFPSTDRVPNTPSPKGGSRFCGAWSLYHLGNAVAVREDKITSSKLNTGFWKVLKQLRGSDFKFYLIREKIASFSSRRFSLCLLTFAYEKHAPDLFAKEPLQLFYGRIITNLSKPIETNQKDNLHIIQSSIMAIYF